MWNLFIYLCCNHVTLDYIFNVMFWSCCAYGLLRFMHKHPLVRVRKRPCFDLKCLVLPSQTRLETAPSSPSNNPHRAATLKNGGTQSWTAGPHHSPLKLLNHVKYCMLRMTQTNLNISMACRNVILWKWRQNHKPTLHFLREICNRQKTLRDNKKLSPDDRKLINNVFQYLSPHETP